jgi:hypothetical protein
MSSAVYSLFTGLAGDGLSCVIDVLYSVKGSEGRLRAEQLLAKEEEATRLQAVADDCKAAIYINYSIIQP